MQSSSSFSCPNTSISPHIYDLKHLILTLFPLQQAINIYIHIIRKKYVSCFRLHANLKLDATMHCLHLVYS
jgi:hypothetical protein